MSNWRRSLLAAAVALALVANVAGVPVATSHVAAPFGYLDTTGELLEVGRGFGAQLACAGCLVGAGIGLASGGMVAALIWASQTGSGLAAIGCVSACAVTLQDLGVL